ncbi:MAG TPA: hypothetical protein VFK36_11885 [Gemmatimonadales bacterium]|nr:hypothetical protein [Gemmatimonadales bacterium]
MSEFFQLIDRTTGNVIKDYETEAAALNELETVARTHGLEEIRDFALLEFRDGLPIRAAMEEELAALVQAIDPQFWGVKTAAAGVAR